jgi:hypothetical protein
VAFLMSASGIARLGLPYCEQPDHNGILFWACRLQVVNSHSTEVGQVRESSVESLYSQSSNAAFAVFPYVPPLP